MKDRPLAAALVAAAAFLSGIVACGGPPLEAELASIVVAGGATAPASTASATTVGGCPVFPADESWNQDVSQLPIDPSSDALIAAMSPLAKLDLALGTRESEEFWGIPYTIVGPDQPVARIEYGTDGEDYSRESDPGPFPIPLDAPIQGGSRSDPNPTSGDRHVIVIQSGTCRLYELYNAVRIDGGFQVSSSASWDLRGVPNRPRGWTSADGAGLPVFPGLLRWEEVASGEIRHALRFTVPRARSAFVAPATHCGPESDPTLPPYGTRVRLKADFDLSPYRGAARVILEAMKRHGLVLADQGKAWAVSGTTDPGFAEPLQDLRDHPVPGAAFEVVQLGSIQSC